MFNQLVLKDWSYKQSTEDNWRPARKGFAATEIHPDLLANGEIEDPFVDDNERRLQWIGESDWEYKTTFTVQQKDAKAHELIFEGLDTFADIYLNGEKILSTENMFAEHRSLVNKNLKMDGENELKIYFHSALLISRELNKKYGLNRGSNGEVGRLHIRKAQYHYGWDWGPMLMTCGPYKPVKLISYDSFLEDVFIDPKVMDDMKEADIEVKAEINTNEEVTLETKIISPDGDLVDTLSNKISKSGTYSNISSISSPKLWYPHTHGTPYLYEFATSVLVNGTAIQTIKKKVGIRKVELVQEPLIDQPGTSFYFRLNNVPVYCNGSDWIPTHSFQTCLTNQDYTYWITLVANGNQNMLRIWGGGYYEQDIFYQECDRFGVLVWHDFMFACGQYPGRKEFFDSVNKEIVTQLRRLRNYCSIALWCGNNEDYETIEKNDLTWDKEDLSGDYTHTNFPARTLYETMFPKLVSEYNPAVPYHPGSPWGGLSTKDNTIGDIHQWNIWHGVQEKYQNWYKLGGRFVSEFGMEGLPSLKTYKDCITQPKQLYPQSYLVDHHNKSDGFERRFAIYVIENIKVKSYELEDWIYATQFMQAECLSYAYRCWRREWRGENKRYLGGALVWQTNDCWPCASWAIIDFYKRPKLAYYSIKRESAPVAVGIYRNEVREDTEFKRNSVKQNGIFDYCKIDLSIDIWGANCSTEDVPAVLKVDFYNVSTGEKISSLPDEEVILKANQTTEIVLRHPISGDIPVVVYSKFISKKDNSIISSAGDWPQPLKYLMFEDIEIDVKVEDDFVTLSTNKPVMGVELLLEKDLFLEDNGFDIFPGDAKKVKILGLSKDDKVSFNFYQKP